MAKPAVLDVYFEDVLVAELRAKQNGTRIDLRYSAAALAKWPLNAPVISCSLPVAAEWQDASAFVAGLLPEGPARERMARMANVASSNMYALLQRFGRDCAGALSIVRQGEPQNAVDAKPAPYSDDQLSAAIADLPNRPLALFDDSELSLPGVQEKMLLVRSRTGWARPIHGLPSTHILKREVPRFPGLAEAEGDCLRLAKAVGLTTITPAVTHDPVAGTHMIVDRYDRVVRRNGSVVRRIHQEDACQALGINVSLHPRAKYEDEGGPSLWAAAHLLDLHSRDVSAEIHRLIEVIAFTVAIGNADCHGKNLSFVHDGAHIALAPLYDTVPTVEFPSLRTRSGMRVGGVNDINKITLGHIVTEVASWSRGGWAGIGASADVALDRIREAATPDLIDRRRARAIRSRIDAMRR